MTVRLAIALVLLAADAVHAQQQILTVMPLAFQAPPFEAELLASSQASWLDVKSGDDITDELRQVINDPYVRLPAGKFYVHDIIRRVNPGGRIEGISKVDTVLIGRGLEGKPLLDLDSSGTVCQHFGVQNAAIGILVAYGPARGTGKHTFDNLAFVDCETGIQAGRKWDDPSSDNVTVRKCYWENCRSCCTWMNGQAVGWYFHDSLVRGPRSERFFNVYSGGNISSQNLKVVAGSGERSEPFTVLHIRNNVAIGSNNCSFTFTGDNKVDNGTGKLQLVRMDKPSMLRVVMEGFHIGTKVDGPHFLDLKGNCTVTLRDFFRVRGGWRTEEKRMSRSQGDDKRPNILIERCVGVPVDNLVAERIGKLRIKGRDNTSYTGAAVPDFLYQDGKLVRDTE